MVSNSYYTIVKLNVGVKLNPPTALLMCQRVQQTQKKKGWHSMRIHKMTSLKGTRSCLHVPGYVWIKTLTWLSQLLDLKFSLKTWQIPTIFTFSKKIIIKEIKASFWDVSKWEKCEMLSTWWKQEQNNLEHKLWSHYNKTSKAATYFEPVKHLQWLVCLFLILCDKPSISIKIWCEWNFK